MWDSAGLERYHALIPSYVKGASVILIVYDISSRNSFNNIGTWVNFIKQVNSDDSLIALCGNKTDLQRNVSIQEGQILADKGNMPFYEVSAKSGDNINRMIYSCIAESPSFKKNYSDNKEDIIKELEGGDNKTKEKNSIIDIVKENTNTHTKGLYVKDINSKNNEATGVIVIRRNKKKKSCC